MSGLLQLKTPPGKPSKLPPDVLEGLQVRLAQRQGFHSYDEIQEWLAQQYNVRAAYATVHGIVRYKLKSKLKAPRPVSIEAEQQVEDTLKKTAPISASNGYLSRTGTTHPLLLRSKESSGSGEAESRFGMKTLSSAGNYSIWVGVKPIAPVQWSRENFWLYGAVAPYSGEHFFYEFSHLDAICFQQFIDLFAATFPDSLNLLHLNQASCHTATTLVWPENVLPIFQPAHSPELNPIERLWEDLKKHFKGKNFDNLSALRDEVFQLINSLSSTTIVSL